MKALGINLPYLKLFLECYAKTKEIYQKAILLKAAEEKPVTIFIKAAEATVPVTIVKIGDSKSRKTQKNDKSIPHFSSNPLFFDEKGVIAKLQQNSAFQCKQLKIHPTTTINHICALYQGIFRTIRDRLPEDFSLTDILTMENERNIDVDTLSAELQPISRRQSRKGKTTKPENAEVEESFL